MTIPICTRAKRYESSEGYYSIPGVKYFLCVLIILFMGCGCAGESPYDPRRDSAMQDRVYAPSFVTGRSGRTASEEIIPPDSPLSLKQAITIALEHNFEILTAEQEKRVEEELRLGTRMKLLPTLLVSGQYARRSTDVPSFSVNADTGELSLAPSISTDRDIRLFSAEASWNLVNLGLDTVSAFQASGRVEISELRLERIKQNITLDVITAYWRTLVAKTAVEATRGYLEEVDVYKRKIDGQAADRIISEVEGLETQIDLINMKGRFLKYAHDFKSAKADLLSAIGCSRDAPLHLPAVDMFALRRPLKREIDVVAYADEALARRPEIRELVYKENISARDAYAAYISMFPEVAPFFRYEHDSDSFLTVHDWYVAGLRVSWDLFNLPGTLLDGLAARQKVRLAARQRSEMAVAILTQLNLAVVDYYENIEKIDLEAELSEKQNALLAAVEKEVGRGKTDYLALLDAKQRQLFRALSFFNSYAESRIDLARIFNTQGLSFEDYVDQVEVEPDLAPSMGQSAESQEVVDPAGRGQADRWSPPAAFPGEYEQRCTSSTRA